ncbi:MAG: filamentous hemagglutinin N-terminal domain-containing protein, partial [Lentisphaeria bacterium]|nr:filamentous hemagglutinin N-terminal domain-containing protein [Lentisphaeria bacterium]
MKTTKQDRLYRTSLSTKFLSVFLVSVLTLSPGGLLAGNLPTGANVVKGGVTINVNGKTMTIDQATAKAIVNWDTFDIGSGYAVNVDQISKNAAMLSRVIGGNPSEILGRLSATGHFYLINPSGILFGQGAQVDVNKFIASTLNLSDDNFMAGKLLFEGNSDASIINEGVINAEAAALIGKNVSNTGTINAQQAALLGTQSVELGNIHGGKLSINFSGMTEESTVTNAGVINATDLGDVTLFAEAGTADNAQGTIIADSAEISGARVDILNLGTLDINSLLIDPTGTLTISDGGVTPIADWGVDGGLAVTDADLEGLIATTGANVTLSFDNFLISAGGTTTNIEVAGSGYSLTLQTNNPTTGVLTFEANTSLTYTGGGELTLTIGSIAGASNITVDAGVLNIATGSAMAISGELSASGIDLDSDNSINITSTINATSFVDI